MSIERNVLVRGTRCRQNLGVGIPLASFLAVALLSACASKSSNDGSRAGSGGSSGQGGVGGLSDCPAGVGAWKSTSPDPLALGMAQYDRCIVLCERTQAASCPSFVIDRCRTLCNYYQNQSVNGWCTEPIEALISCFEELNDPCQNPQYLVAGSCDAESEDVDCCRARYCADPVNAGRCG
jgi:hypothetical protein